MENIIRHARKVIFQAAVCALLIVPCVDMQAQSAVEKALFTKAHSLESSGHLDMAAQTWEQILLMDASNKEALLGVARADMRLGKKQEAQRYLDRLRAAGGSSADIASVEAMANQQPQAARLKEAVRLSQQGKYDDAMRIYRDVFGSNPPAGDYALSYYDTEAAIPSARAHAIAGLRQLSNQFPADSRYAVTLGRVLTYDPKTREEGIAILSQYGSVAAAKSALEQAQTWNKKPSPAVATDSTEARTGAQSATVTSPESLAYRALNSGRIDDAKKQFQDILNRQPNNRDGLAGMGYVAMKEQNFSAAADYFERARAAGSKGVASALSSAQFWVKMSAAANELKAGNADTAVEGYRAALELKPNDPDGLEGLGGALGQAGKNEEAVTAFEQAVSADGQRASAWKGLFLAQSAAADVPAALDTNAHIPKSVIDKLAKDPDYLRVLAQDYIAAGKKEDADRALARALALPFPNEGRDLPVQAQLQYASLLVTAKKYDPAIRLYRQVLAKEPESREAWIALVAAQHQMNADDEALTTVGQMPQPVFEKEQSDPAFLALVGSIYQSRHDLSHAQKYLERAATLSPARSSTQMQLADIYAAQGNAAKAYAIYVREHDRDPSGLQAWRGMLNSLHLLNRDRDALRQIASMPEFVRLRLEEDVDYLQVLASIQSSTGQPRAAIKTFEQVSQIYARQNKEEPVEVQIQYGWILLKSGDDRRLYTLISNLSSSSAITDEQQTALNSLWASWSTQRANAALAAGDQRRALAILTAAAQAFPQNEDVYSSLAGAYMKSGQPKQALAIYSSRNMDQANLQQYEGAIGSAMAANNLNIAHKWLEMALDRFKDNPTILKMAAQYEQARGNSEGATAYYRAALNASGPAPAGGGLLPQPGEPGYSPSPAQQLMHLLAPPGSSARLNDMNLPDADTSADSLRESAEMQAPTLGDYANTIAPGNDSLSARNDDSLAARAEARDRLPMLEASNRDIVSVGEPIRREPAPARRLSVVRPASAPVAPVALETPLVYIKSIPAPVAPLPQRQRELTTAAASYAGMEYPAGGKSYTEVHEITSQPVVAQDYIPQDPARPSTRQQDLPNASSPASSLPILDGLPSSTEQLEGPQLPLPRLSGSTKLPVRPKSEREQIEEQLEILEGASSNWIGASAVVDYRSGQPGYDRLSIFSTPIEASTSLSHDVRATFVVKPVLLDAGQADSQATVQ